jgi:hypothetical protein
MGYHPGADAKVGLGIETREHFCAGTDDVGKSFVASALAQKACRDGYSAL